MHIKLKENADFLKAKGSKLSREEVTRLILMKPWPVLVGIGMVPLIAHPFDKMWLKVQDWTIRPLLGKNKIIRTSEGKLQSIHNPEFWVQQKTTPPVPQVSRPVPAPQSGAAPSPNQAMRYPEFDAFHPVNHPFVWPQTQPSLGQTNLTQPLAALPAPFQAMGFPLGTTLGPVQSGPTAGLPMFYSQVTSPK